MSAIEKEVIKLNIPDETIISEKEFIRELMPRIEDRIQQNLLVYLGLLENA